MSATVSISSPNEWSNILGSSTIVVADFYADWCGPCKMIAPTFESLSTKYSKPGKITFCKVNVDNQQSIASAHNVKAMPTFLILKSGTVIETVQGANPPSLTNAVEKAVKLVGSTAPGASFKTPGRALGGSGAASARGGGRTLGRPSAWRLDSFGVFNAILTFFGLYFVSLFSFDAFKSAENSSFNVHKPREPAAPARGSGGPGGQKPRGGNARPTNGIRTLADLGGS